VRGLADLIMHLERELEDHVVLVLLAGQQGLRRNFFFAKQEEVDLPLLRLGFLHGQWGIESLKGLEASGWIKGFISGEADTSV
jgi:hypothetical protein